PEPARHVTLPHVHVLQSVTDEEIVQNRHAGDVLQEAKYMLVAVRIADVVEDAVIPFGIRAEPFYRTKWNRRRNLRRCDCGLIGSSLDVVMTGQLRREPGTVIRDA